jgi:hypothetical protein
MRQGGQYLELSEQNKEIFIMRKLVTKEDQIQLVVGPDDKATTTYSVRDLWNNTIT